MKLISLGGKLGVGRFAIVDDEDFALHRGSESPLISFAVGGMQATKYRDNKFLNKFFRFFKFLYICTYL